MCPCQAEYWRGGWCVVSSGSCVPYRIWISSGLIFSLFFPWVSSFVITCFLWKSLTTLNNNVVYLVISFNRWTCTSFTSWLWLAPKVATLMGTGRNLSEVIAFAILEMVSNGSLGKIAGAKMYVALFFRLFQTGSLNSSYSMELLFVNM